MNSLLTYITEKLGISARSIIYLIMFDILTKILAFNILPMDRYCFSVNGLFALRMTLHEYSLFEGYQYPFCLILFAIICIFLKKSNIKMQWKILVGLASFAAIYLAGSYITKTLGIQKSDRSIIFLLGNLSQICAYFIFWRIAESLYFKRVFGFTLATVIGNTLSCFYPPYSVIDFIVFSPVSMIYGSTAIFNFADAYFITAIILFAFSPIYFLFG
jgi:hypothetical protein